MDKKEKDLDFNEIDERLAASLLTKKYSRTLLGIVENINLDNM